MAAWLFTAAAWMLLLAGVFVAWRFGCRDPGKGTRRCPKCWYDMSATAGLKCPECGREATAEKRLRRRRIRRRWIVAGVVIALASWVPFKWPEYQRLSMLRSGALAFVPKTLLVVTWPWLVEWQESSFQRPNAWWAKPNANTFLNVNEAIRPSELRYWQRLLLGRSIRATFLKPKSSIAFGTAADLMFGAKDFPESVTEAYITGFCHAPEDWGLRLIRNGTFWYPLPDQASHAIAAEFERRPSRMYSDDESLWWPARNGASVDPVARAFLGTRPKSPRLEQVIAPLSAADLLPETARLLLLALRDAKTVDSTSLGRLLRSADLRSAEFDREVESVLRGKNMYAAGFLCEGIAKRGVISPASRQALEAVACDDQADARFLARMTLMSLDGDLNEIPSVIEDAHADAMRDSDLFSASMRLSGLYRLGTLSNWPRDLRWTALWAAIDKRPADSLYGDCHSATLELINEFGAEVRTVSAFADGFQNNLVYSWVALDEYTKNGSVPKPLLDAAKQYVATQDSKSQENLRKRFEALR